MPERSAVVSDPAALDPHPEPALAGAGVSGDFQRTYTRHFAFVWRSLRALGVKAPALDDAVQDVFLVVHRRLHEFEGRASLSTWLFSIVERVAANHRRHVQRKQAPLEPLDGALATSAPDPLDRAEDAQAARFVQTFVDTLDAGKRAVFVLALVERMPAPEIAEALGIPLNTVYSRLRVVRRAFRDAALAFEELPP